MTVEWQAKDDECPECGAPTGGPLCAACEEEIRAASDEEDDA